jgi:hypothetical protein
VSDLGSAWFADVHLAALTAHLQRDVMRKDFSKGGRRVDPLPGGANEETV